MPEIAATPISDSIRLDLQDIAHVEFQGADLRVALMTANHELHVLFRMPVGFRLLDEGDLLEFWPQCSLDRGWLYEVKSGGWRDLESSRPGFLTQHHSAVSEFLLVTQNSCLSVLSAESPNVTEVT